jgi:hypothetical protein
MDQYCMHASPENIAPFFVKIELTAWEILGISEGSDEHE